MADDRFDFSSLDPTRDTARFDEIARAITRDAMHARATGTREPTDFASAIVAMWRPALLAAGIAIAAAIPVVIRMPRAAPPAAASPTDVLGIPRQLVALMHSDRTPTLAELHDALAVDAQLPQP